MSDQVESISFDCLHAESIAIGERGDCAVKAVAVVCGVPYGVAYQALAEQGRKPRHGTFHYQTDGAVQALGFKLVPVPSYLYGKTVRTAERKLHADKVYLIRVTNHVLAAKGGKVIDWSQGRLKRIQHIYEVNPLETELIPKAVVVPELPSVVKPVVKQHKVNPRLSLTQIVLDTIEANYRDAGRPTCKKQVLALRKSTMDQLQAEHGIKRTTSSNVMAKWQKTIVVK